MNQADMNRKVCLTVPADPAYAPVATLALSGLGMIAITYGHQRSNPDIIWIAVILTILIVQIIQEIGMRVAHKTDKRRK